MLLNQVGDDLSVRLSNELVAFGDQLFLQCEVVLNNAVVHHNDLAGAITMRVRVLFGRAAVSGPASVPNAVRTIEWLGADGIFQIAQLAFSATHLQAITIAAHGNAGRVVSTVFELAQPFNDDRDDL